MVGYFLLIVFTIVAWCLVFVGNRYDRDGVLTIGIVLTILLTTFSIVSSVYLGTRASEADAFRKTRDYYQELVMSVSDDMSPETIAKIISSAENVNTRIEKHKRHCNSEMCGFLYSKGIAEMEPVKIPKYKFSIEIEE